VYCIELMCFVRLPFDRLLVARALLQTQVPRPPVKGARKLSPAVDRKSVAGNPQTRLRRYTNVGVNASTNKLASKRNVSLGGNLNFDPDSSGVFPLVTPNFWTDFVK
jgi:hypothetical protein